MFSRVHGAVAKLVFRMTDMCLFSACLGSLTHSSLFSWFKVLLRHILYVCRIQVVLIPESALCVVPRRLQHNII